MRQPKVIVRWLTAKKAYQPCLVTSNPSMQALLLTRDSGIIQALKVAQEGKMGIVAGIESAVSLWHWICRSNSSGVW